ncbi:MAG: hypothetical protein HY554_07160 [Elusimicrobia bacterium]|nr:hypothetical protein [Elusimicrobiota bacterium]
MEPLLTPRGKGTPSKRDRQRRIELAVVVAISLIGVAVGLELVRRHPADGTLAGVGPMSWTSRPQAPGLDRPIGESHLAPEDDKELSFNRLMDILGAEAEKPAIAPLAKAFARDFMSKPPLKKTYEDFKRRADNGERPKAKDFLGSLRAAPAFQKLASDILRGGGGSGSGGAMMALVQHPELKRFLNQQDRALGPSGASSAMASKDRDRRAAMLQGGTQSSQGPDYLAKVAGIGASPNAPGATDLGGGPLGYHADGGQTLSSQGAAAGAPDAAQAPKDSKSVSVKDKEKDPAHNVPGFGGGGGLKTPATEDMDKAISTWLNTYLKDKRKAVEDGIQAGLTPWGACFKAGALQDCITACENPPDRVSTNRLLFCNPPKPGYLPYFRACMDANNDSETACLLKCRQQAPCTTDPGAWKTHCGTPEKLMANRAFCKFPPGNSDELFKGCHDPEPDLRRAANCRKIPPELLERWKHDLCPAEELENDVDACVERVEMRWAWEHNRDEFGGDRQWRCKEYAPDSDYFKAHCR